MSSALRRHAAGVCLALLVAFAAAAPVARAEESLVRVAISKDAAVALVRSQTQGKVVRVDRREEGSNLVYRVRVLKPDGRLRDYWVDAATGEIH